MEGALTKSRGGGLNTRAGEEENLGFRYEELKTNCIIMRRCHSWLRLPCVASIVPTRTIGRFCARGGAMAKSQIELSACYFEREVVRKGMYKTL